MGRPLLTIGELRALKAFGPLTLIELALEERPQFLPGQFAMVEVPKRTLMRPFSILFLEENRLGLLIRPKGPGTKTLVDLKVGTPLRVLLPLGKGFPLDEGGETWLVAGGVGVAALFCLALELSQRGGPVRLFWGAKDHQWFPYPLFFRLREQGVEVLLCTEDGSLGVKGFVTDVLPHKHHPRLIYACGPEEMLKELIKKVPKEVPLYVSLEARMACGLGACRSCVHRTPYGYKLVCQDGPVFRREELPWH